MSDEMDIERALHIARLWRAGKLIGEDIWVVSDHLLTEVERLREQNERYAAEGQRLLDQLRAFEESGKISDGIGVPTPPAPAPR
jgi:hypothetical protein